MAREINLVPDVKNDMIKTLKLRNLIFFISIIVTAVSVGIIAILGSIVGGQEIAINNKKSTLESMSNKIGSYKDLNDFLTIRDQLGNLSTLAENKQVLSRTFNVLSALLPTGADTITISELNVNLAETSPTFSFDAQANAGREPFIDYNVLDSFKKSMKYMRYDYGQYVDKEGADIPGYCIIETGSDGATLNDGDKGLYAYWTINAEGCNPSDAEVISSAEADVLSSDSSEEEESEDTENTEGSTSGNMNSTNGRTNSSNNSSSSSSSSSSRANNNDGSTEATEISEEVAEEVDLSDAYIAEDYEGTDVIRIWRTPQFDEWYDSGNMTLDGQISGIPHFNSNCITYSGETTDNDQVKWSESNESCTLVPDGDDGIRISDSSNGRGAGDELVLRFSAVISLSPDIYSFRNEHMIAIAPAGRRNVTDSYVQIQAMFGEKARDCAEGDTACSSNTTNLNGGNN